MQRCSLGVCFSIAIRSVSISTEQAINQSSATPDSSATNGLILVASISCIAAIVARLVLIFHFDLLVDEALYCWIGLRNPLTLAPHPPGIPLLARSMIEIFGRHEWAVRLPSLLMMTAVPWLVFVLLKRMGVGRLAWWIVIILNAVPLYVGFGAVLTPDASQLFLWCALLILSYDALETGSTASWLALGAALGLGLAIKYVLVLLAPSLLLTMLLVPHWRRQLSTPKPYIAALVTAFMLLGLVWLTGFESARETLRYHLAQRQHWDGFDPRNAGIFHLAHLAYISPVLYLLAIYVMIRCALTGWRTRDRQLLFAFSFSVVMFGFFALISALTERRLTREHWDAPAYVMALGGAVLLMQRGALKIRPWLMAGSWFGGFVILVVILEVLTGRVSSLVGAKQPFSSFRGWRELAAHIDKQVATTSPDAAPLVLARNFQIMVEYNFYGTATQHLYKLDDKLDLKWGLTGEWKRDHVEVKDFAEHLGANTLFVREDFQRHSNQTSPKPDEWIPILKSAFQQTQELPSLTISSDPKATNQYQIYWCETLRDPTPLIAIH